MFTWGFSAFTFFRDILLYIYKEKYKKKEMKKC